MVGLLRRNDRGVRSEHEMDAGIGDQVGLELRDVDVEGAIETEGGRQGRNRLGDEAVQVGVGGALDVEVATANVVQSFVVNLIFSIFIRKIGWNWKEILKF